MRLYEYASFPNPRRVRISLAEKGASIPHEQVDVPAAGIAGRPAWRRTQTA